MTRRDVSIQLFRTVTLFVAIGFSIHAFGSHLRAGEITINAKTGVPNVFIITIHGWVNTQSQIHFGGSESLLNFGDGMSMVLPELESIPRPDLGTNIGEVIYSIEHVYSGSGFFIVSYSEPNRNAGILNMDNNYAIITVH